MYHVDITNEGDYLFKARSKDAEFTIDTKGKGITPPDTLLASLGSCVGVYIRKYCDGAKIPLKDFSVSVDAEFEKGAKAYFKEIRVSVGLKGVVIDERRKAAVLEFIRNCPVHNTLKNNPDVKIEIT